MRLRAIPAEQRLPWLVCSWHVLAFADRFLISSVAAPLESQLHIDDAAMGVVLGPAVILPYAAFIYLLGRRLDPGRAAWLLPIALRVAALAIAVGASAQGEVVLLLSRALLGLGEAGFDAAALVLLAGSAATFKARSFALFTAGAYIGKALALTGGGLLLHSLGHRLISTHPDAS